MKEMCENKLLKLIKITGIYYINSKNAVSTHNRTTQNNDDIKNVNNYVYFNIQ